MVSVETVEHLANRPPTPPKESYHDVVNGALQLLQVDLDDAIAHSQDSRPQPGTPPVQPSPPSSQGTGSHLKSVKRVEFSPCITALEPPSRFATSAGTASPVSRRFPSSKQPRPIKSILKATLDLQTPTPDAVSPAPDYFSISDPKTFPAMLDSVLKFLDAPATAMRLDGYSTLNGALKAYDDLPDIHLLRSKMPLLIKYMSRDITESARKSDPMTSSLTTQALKLATAILMLPALDDTIDEQFQTLLVDRAIEVLEQDPVPKSIANHHMFLLATQRFSSKVVTSTKVERIVSSLSTIHERVSGNSVIASRLVIFQRLMEQASSVMLGNMRDWMPHIFHGVLSSIKDVRVRAIDTGNQAAMLYGTIYQSTKVIIDIFHTATGEGGTYGAYFTARLFDMAKQKGREENIDLQEAVPQIWSMVVLFFRSRPVKLSQWRLFCEEWFLLIQNCLNSKNLTVKFRATCAWNRLVYVVNPDHEMREKMEGWDQTLRVPFVYILHNTKGRDKKSKEIRHIALSGYCNLLHYALRPSQSWEDLDYFWDYYVNQVLSKLLLSGGRDANMACRVLKALFDGKSTVWDEEAANKAPMLPEALTRLDPKWVRSRTRIILDLLGPFLELSLGQPGDGHGVDETPWRELMTAIASAGSHEVLRSQELKECLAHLMNLFSRIWLQAPGSDVPSDDTWISRFTSLVQCSIEIIGPLPFGEENLSRNETKVFEAAPTPSNRASKHHEKLQSSAVFLFELFGQPPSSVNLDASYFDAAKKLLHQVCQGRSSRKERLEIIRKCAQANSTSGSVQLWQVAVQETTAVLRDTNLNESVQEPARLGHQARHAIFVLATGLHYPINEDNALSAPFELVETLAKILKQEAGDGGVALGLMEPMAEMLLKDTDRPIPRPVLIQFATKLLKEGTFPRNKQQMDEGRRSLYNTHPPFSRQSSFEPFTQVYELVKSTLLISYDNIDETAIYLADFVEATQSFLSKCPLSLFASPVLRKMQTGIAQVIKDDSCVIAGNNNSQKLSSKIFALWQSILDHLKHLPSNKTLLRALDELFAGGLNSTHRDIINISVSSWNNTFGRLDSLEYPEKVEYAIRRLRPLVDLDLPTFPEKSHDPEPPPLQLLSESQQDDNTAEMPTPTRRTLGKRSQRLSAFDRGISASPQREKMTTRRQPAAKNAPKSKLRHNDSQVEFTAVESSSPVQMDSQLMTDHQKEVKSRQRFETAPMYPDFSSSPGPQTRSSRSALPKLNFSREQAVTESGYATPTFNEEQGPMDDYVTSSPTPKAAEKSHVPNAEQSSLRQADIANAVSDVDDTNIPSSPPEMADETVYEGTTELESLQAPGTEGVDDASMETDFTKPEQVAQIKSHETPANEKSQPSEVVPNAHPSLKRLRKDFEGGTSSDVFLDARSELTNVERDDRAKQEAKAREIGERADQATHDADRTESNDSSPLHFTDSISEQPQGLVSVDETTMGEPENVPAEGLTSRVLDSFVGSIPADGTEESSVINDAESDSEQAAVETASQTDVDVPRSKRKRTEAGQPASVKRRKSSNSPLKRIMSFFSASQPDDNDDEDMQDCIVVGSQTGQETESQPEVPEEAPVPESAPPSVVPASIKRGRGRPRKSEPTMRSSPVSSVMTRASKRRASTLEDDESQESLIADTPAPSKFRRTTRSQDAKSGQPVEHIMLPNTRRRARTLQAVVIETSSQVDSGEGEDHESQQEADEADENDSQEANSQLKQEEEAAIRSRVIIKPKSLIGRLKGILQDCKTMVLGSHEEREFQDVMFELGREVYEARRRSREAGRD